MAEQSRKPRPKKAAPVADVTPPPVTVTPPAPLGPPPPSVVGPPPGFVSGSSWIPWGEVESAYLAPTISSDGSTAAWPSLGDLASRFGCSLQTIKDRSSEFGWTARQKAAQDLWWAEHNAEVNRTLAHRAANFRLLSFAAANRAVTRSHALLQGEPDSGALLRSTSALKTSFEVGLKALGAESASQFAGVGVMVNLSGTERAEPGNVSLWSVLIQARRDAVPTVDAFDLPSPLPASLASTR